MNADPRYDIHTDWDAEGAFGLRLAKMFWGFSVQAETFDELVGVIAALVPELLMENHMVTPDLIPIRILAERTATVRTAA